jgi:hypothetical protein
MKAMQNANSTCRLCGGASRGGEVDALFRNLYRCPQCGYVYVAKSHFLKSKEEKERYAFHQNSAEDQGYVAFLERLIKPLESYLKKGATILDYGSGPEPVLAQLFKKRGFNTHIYDPFFSPLLVDEQCDAITATEVFEHFHNPKKELEIIFSLIDRGGFLGIMTERYTAETDFKTWYYTKDPTHVGFFSDKTFRWIEANYKLRSVYDDGERVIIWQTS